MRSRLRGIASLVLSTILLTLDISAIHLAEAVTGCTSGSFSTTNSGNVRIVRFSAPTTGNGVCTWTVPDGVFVIEYLVVAGGGGGGSGGGGGGGVIFSTNPQSVTPGEDLSVIVGAGGTGGIGGINGTTYSTNGSDSVLGSITAVGGGAGGAWNRFVTPTTGNQNGAIGGSTGGDAYDAATSAGQTASGTVVVGATSLGSSGGGSPGGAYSAGGGGGGAGSAGGNARRPSTAPAFNANNTCQPNTNCTNFFFGGGNGGSGYVSSISGSAVEYGCGGGGGINSNSNTTVTNGGGSAGCSNAGRGSSWGFSGSTGPASSQATSGAAGTGGGGGGTDPEDSAGAAGGSGIVVVKYTLVDENCPNNGSNAGTAPLACPNSLTVQADGVSVAVQVLGSPISYSGAGASVTVLSSPVANPTSGNLLATANGNNLNVSVPSGSSLIGGTYPLVYRITQSGTTSDSYVLVTVEDPTQLTPGVIPLDPRETNFTVPPINLGASPNVLLCMIVRDSGAPTIALSAPASTGVTQQARTRGLSFSGSAANVSAAISSLTASVSSSVLTPNGSRTLEVNVTNTNNGGNNSCAGGTSSTIELRPITLRTGFTNDLPLNRR